MYYMEDYKNAPNVTEEPLYEHDPDEYVMSHEEWVTEAFERQTEPEDVHESLVNLRDLRTQLTPDEIHDVYTWYAVAMQRRDREPLEEDRFIGHFFEAGSWDATFVFGDIERGFTFGFYKHGIFIPTHFAPKTPRGGYDLFKMLAEHETLSVATAVTEDIATTLRKMKGWHRLHVSFLAYFNDMLQEKTVLFNSAKGTRQKMVGLVKEFWRETKSLRENVRGDY
jgi:hypothetical protein